MRKSFIILGVFLLFISSCKVTQNYQIPELKQEALYRKYANQDTNSIAQIHWKDFFQDSQLQLLIDESLLENLDLKMAMERINVANAYFKQSKLEFYPNAQAGVSVTQSKLSFPQGFGLIDNSTQYQFNISSSWELDIWGKLKSNKKAALAALLQTEAAKRAIQSQLISEIAYYYYNLIALDKQLEILEKTLNIRKEDVQVMKDLKASNIVNGAAVVQSEANLYTVEVAIPDVKRQIAETENAISFLLGSPSKDILRKQLDVLDLPKELSVGVPAQLLQFRPDIQMAELDFRVAFEKTNIAKTAFYPTLTITANAGFSSLDFAKWFTADGLFANIMGGITQPLFNRGLNKANLSSAEARQMEAFHNFRKSMLNAGKEVSNALVAYKTSKEKESSRTMQLNALRKSVEFTKELLKYTETTNYTDVLTSEQNLLNAELGLINDQLQQWLSVISLYKSTGGGAM